ncbi:Arylsulfatase precursor [Planctomycetes bacterium Pan216]|uniref:Arylsulfatase n=1 Tax=Kolteria novifilia TaxID=2527975 RepID=A0A518B900_9BACT|nr:Arylsulfatase precursor [Planctomycetes bacterium Pan216]
MRPSTFALACLLSAVGSFSLAGRTLADNPDRPNILFILADDVGCETLGCYGGESYKTPHLDNLAKEGMRFRYGFSMPVCHPTRLSVMTAKYPFRMDYPKWGSFPKAEEPHAIAQRLKKAGYATAVAGKWQMTLLKDDPEQPKRCGFDESCLFGWHEGPRYYQPLIWQNGSIRDDVADRYGPEVYSDFLIDFMAKNKDCPFFAYYPMALCHDVTDDLEKPVPYGPNGRWQNYVEMAESMDDQVGRLMAALDKLGLRERTLVFFTTDNGTPTRYLADAKDGKYIRIPVSSMRDGKEIPGGKGSLLNTGTNVPMIARWPGKVPPGSVVDDLVDVSDFLPTFAELAGHPVGDQEVLDGVSFANRLEGNGAGPRKWAYAAKTRGKRPFFVRDQRWKLYDSGRLYDVANDYFERHPIKKATPESTAARTKLQPVVDELKRERSEEKKLTRK